MLNSICILFILSGTKSNTSDRDKYITQNLAQYFTLLSLPIGFIINNCSSNKTACNRTCGNCSYIFEKINDFADEGSKADILNKIRLSLSRQICKTYTNDDDETISAFEISEKTYSDIVLNCDESEDSLIKIDGVLAEKLANKIIRKAKKLNIYSPKLIVPMEYRQIFFTLLSLYINNITVLAQEEIGCAFKIDSLGEI